LLTGHDEIVKILGDDILKKDYADLLDLSRCDPRNKHSGNFNFCEDVTDGVIVEKERLDSRISSYEMKNKPRGICLIISNYFTIGTYKEMQCFRNIFQNLHFDVIMKKNMNKNHILKLFLEISKMDELDKHNAFVCMIIAHGNSKNELYDFDGETFRMRDLMDLMNPGNCPKLSNKPRLFFFNCCRIGKMI
jgi:hypothetical protein